MKVVSLDTARRLSHLLPRPWINRVRTAAYTMMPVAHRSACGAIVHACVWKTASQWVKAVLSDPRVYRAGGLATLELTGGGHWPALLAQNGGRLPRRTIVTPAYRAYGEVAPHLGPANARAFFVYRDLRDLIVSRYFSDLMNHPKTGAIMEKRRRLQELDREAGLIEVIGYSDDFVTIVDDWLSHARTDAAVLILRYEDLTGPDQAAHWQRLFAHCDIALAGQKVETLLHTYRFEALTGGRAKGQEQSGHKYRKGEPGDWVNHFTPAVARAFDARFPGVVERWGYGRG